MQSPDFSIYGAVDLGARQAAAQRKQQAAEAGAPDGTGTVVLDVTEETFNTLVDRAVSYDAGPHRPVGGLVRAV